MTRIFACTFAFNINRNQFAVGLAVPAQVPNRTIFTNLGTLSNIPLPSKINQLYPYKGKGRQLTHNYFYKSLKTAFNWYVFNYLTRT